MSSGEDKIRLKIKELETEYARTQKNKATEGHLGLLKAKLSKLRRELLGKRSLGFYCLGLHRIFPAVVFDINFQTFQNLAQQGRKEEVQVKEDLKFQNREIHVLV